MSSTLRAAVIGVGYLGRFHAQKYKLTDGVQLVGVSDANVSRGHEVASELNIDFISDYKSLLGRVDLVTIASSTQSHFEVAKWFLENDIHVLCEKPITVSSTEALTLCELAEKRNLNLQVGHVERFNPAYTEARPKIKNPKMIEALRLAPFTPRGADVNVVLDIMIHDIDLVLDIAGSSEITKISAAGTSVLTGSVDVATARLEFASGLIADLKASRASLTTERRMTVFEDNRYAVIDFGKGTVDWISGTRTSAAPEMKHESKTVDKGDALLFETRSFIESVQKKQAPLVTGRNGLNALKVAEQISGQILERSKNSHRRG